MSTRVAVGDPRVISVKFPDVATGDVSVSVASAREGTTAGPFVATSLGGGNYSYQLIDSMVDAVDDLRLTFTGLVDGINFTRTEWVDVAGAYYFEVDEARSIGPIDPSFTDADIERQRTAVEDQIEANCDTSFVSRYIEQRTSGRGSYIRLSENYILDLISVTEDGVDVTSGVELDGRYVHRNSHNGEWASGHRNVVLKYEGGYDEHPPGDLRRKAIEATRYSLLRERRQGLPAQALTIATEAGTMRMAVAGLRQPFGLPEVDAVVVKWAKRVCVPVAGT
jgi:hypothetical protein